MTIRKADAPQEAKDIAWKAQLRLNGRYRKLVGRGKKSNVAVTAVALELVGLIWGLARWYEPMPGTARNPRARIWTGNILCPKPERGSLSTHSHHGVTNPRTRA